MKAKALRLAVLLPLALALVSLLGPLFPKSSSTTDFFMTPYTAFGISALAIVWFLYLSGYRFARKLLLIQGLISLVLTALILASYFLHFAFPLERFLVPPSSAPFLLNLTLMFLACYSIQVATYWLPRTKVVVNALLAVILFMALLSIFGHVYNLHGIRQEALLLPMRFGAILGFLILSLVIFAHTNRMERLYLNSKILLSFALMFIAIVGANVVIYQNINKTVDLSTKIDNTRHVLSEIYNVDFYLDSAQTETQAYEITANPAYVSSYENNKQSYHEAIQYLKEHTTKSEGVTSINNSVSTVAQLGDEIIALSDSTIAQEQHKALPPVSRSAIDTKMDAYMDQLVDEIKSVSIAYTNQLDQFVEQESYSGRGIILGVSTASALSLLLIIFTPLFIRQTIQKLSATQEQLKDSNKQLSEEKSRAEAVLTSIGDGLFAVDTDHTITIFNPAAEALTGVQKQDALGRHYDEVMHFATVDGGHAELDFTNKALRGVESHLTHNVVLKHGEDQKIDVQISAAPVKNKAGSVVGAIIVFRDRSSEQALENAKDEFVSLASHQLRTPATATKQFLAMFLQGYAGTIDDKQRMFLQQAYDNNELGINIIEELLNITRLESNKFKVVKEKVELTDFLRANIEQHKAFADRGKQTVHLVAPHKHVYIEADVSLLGMAVDNLITNALKYSGEGSTVTVRLSDGDSVAVSVSDTGIGIKKADMPKIFQRFSRLEDPQMQHVSGTGIGLYLVQKIVQRLHAKIKVDSEYGKGSTFTLAFKPLE